MSRNNMGGCDPIAPPSEGGGGQSIRSRMYELTQVGPEDYKAVVIPMWVTLDATETSATVTYRPPTMETRRPVHGDGADVDPAADAVARDQFQSMPGIPP